MKKNAIMSLLVVALLVGGPTTAQQATSDNLDATCMDLLLDDIRGGLSDQELMSLATRDRVTLGTPLPGTICPAGKIAAYFVQRGWELLLSDEGEIQSRGPSGTSDHRLQFCLPPSLLMRWLRRCRATATIYLNDGRLTHVDASFSI